MTTQRLTLVTQFLCFIAPSLAAAQEPTEARTALVIGVGNYADRYFNTLEAPETDAQAMAEKLKALGFDVTLKLNATRREMLAVTDTFGETLAKRQGVGLFYFSGHGSLKADEPDPNFLIPTGTTISSREDLPQEAFNAQRVANRMKEAGNRLNLIFLDACRDNALPSRSKDAAGGLSAMRGASGLMFFFATQPNQIAIEDSANKRSLFTHALLKNMATPGLSFMDMMADVTAETEKLSAEEGKTFRQSPFMSGTLSGRFTFVPVSLPRIPSTTSPPAIAEKPTVVSSFGPDVELKAGATRLISLPGGERITLCYCPAGSFVMGSQASEEGRNSVTEAQVTVRLTEGFWMAQTECTQGQWEAISGINPSEVTGNKDLPVETVSWEDVQAYLEQLNEKAALPPGWRFALPTEAQWEYACRAGTQSAFAFGDTLSSRLANFNYDRKKIVEVGGYKANAWGLHDMHGNVDEWCSDRYSDLLSGGTDPSGGSTGNYRMARGGCWRSEAASCRAASRGNLESDYADNSSGFRLALVHSISN